ncbi:MAG TPA: hypothetical protein VFU02_24325, partial [Polyangiaceae bacterium]|nr:hypothetical protein [Polyangiaceae bacterium]
TLGVNSSGPVVFGYASVAGSASETMPELPLDFETPAWPDELGGPWYIAVAKGNLDGDDTYSGFVSTSLSAEIASIHLGE